MQRADFAEAMPGHGIGADTEFAQQREQGRRVRADRGLCPFGAGQAFALYVARRIAEYRPGKHHRMQWCAGFHLDGGGLVPDPARGFELHRDRPAHAEVLTALAREQHRDTSLACAVAIAAAIGKIERLLPLRGDARTRTAQALLRLRAQMAAQLQQGHHLLASARYKLGTDRVSASQLPGEESEHLATWRVTSDDAGRSTLEAVTPAPKNSLRLFGVLLPQEMKLAQQAFQKAATLAVEVSNLQKDLATYQSQFELKSEKKEE